MNELMLNNDVRMTSLELTDLLNRFRKEEGKPIKLHKNLMRDIRNEVETLRKLGVSVELNFEPYSYIAENGKENLCYRLNKQAILQMANRESALVRYRTIEYIQALEMRIQNINNQRIISEKDNQIKRLEALIGLRCKDKFQYGKIIKNHLGITKANADYETIKQMFFFELGITRWEQITYDRKNVILLKGICEDYAPSTQISLF